MYDILIVFCLLKNVFSRSRSNFLDFDEENQQIYCMLVRNDNNKTGKGGGSVFMKLFVHLSFIFVLALIRLYNFYNSTM